MPIETEVSSPFREEAQPNYTGRYMFYCLVDLEQYSILHIAQCTKLLTIISDLFQ